MSKRRLDIKVKVRITESINLATSMDSKELESANIHDVLRHHLIFIQGSRFNDVTNVELLVSLNVLHVHLCLFKSLITEEIEIKNKLIEIVQRLILSVKSPGYYDLYYRENLEYLNV